MSVEVKHGDKVLLKCGDDRRAATFAEAYNRGWHAAKADKEDQ